MSLYIPTYTPVNLTVSNVAYVSRSTLDMAIDERIAKNQSLTLDNKPVTTSEAIFRLAKQLNQLDDKLVKLEQDMYNSKSTSEQSEESMKEAVKAKKAPSSDKQCLSDLQKKLAEKEQEMQDLRQLISEHRTCSQRPYNVIDV